MSRLALCCLGFLVFLAGVTAEAPKKVDPVRELHNALEWPPSFLPPSPRIVEAYKKRIRALADRIVSPIELCQALTLLHRLPHTIQIDEVGPELRSDLGKRAVVTLRKALQDKDRSRRLGIAVLIGQTAKGEAEGITRGAGAGGAFREDPRQPRPKQREGSALTPLTDDLDRLQQNDPELLVRRAALQALFQLKPKPDLLAAALTRGMKSKELSERRLAAQLAGRVFQIDPLRHPSRYEMGRVDFATALAPVLTAGVADADASVRRHSLEGLTSALRQVSEDFKFLFRDHSVQLWRHGDPQDEDSPHPASEFARFKGAADALERALLVAAKSLGDEDLGCCLAAHKGLEIAATARLHLRDQQQLIDRINAARDTPRKKKDSDDTSRPHSASRAPNRKRKARTERMRPGRSSASSRIKSSPASSSPSPPCSSRSTTKISASALPRCMCSKP